MEDGDSAFLQIGLCATRRYKMVVIMIPRDVWDDPGGRTVEIEDELFRATFGRPLNLLQCCRQPLVVIRSVEKSFAVSLAG